MKSVAALVLFAAASLAQDLGSLSECGKMCVNNMLDLAPSLGCERTDVACLCDNIDFGYGVRDCATEACPNDDLESITSTAQGMCPDDGGDGGSTTGAPSGSETATGGAPDETDTDTDKPTGGMTTTMMTSKSMPGPTGSMTDSKSKTGGSSETDSASPTSTSGDDSGSGSGSGSATATGAATTGSEGVAARTAVPGIAGALGVMAVLAA